MAKKKAAAGRGAKKFWVAAAYRSDNGLVQPATQGPAPEGLEKGFLGEDNKFIKSTVFDKRTMKKVSYSTVTAKINGVPITKKGKTPKSVQKAVGSGPDALQQALRELADHDKQRLAIVARIQRLTASL